MNRCLLLIGRTARRTGFLSLMGLALTTFAQEPLSIGDSSWSPSPVLRERQFDSLLATTSNEEWLSVSVIVKVRVDGPFRSSAPNQTEGSLRAGQLRFVDQLQEKLGAEEFARLSAPRLSASIPVVHLDIRGRHLPHLRVMPEVLSIERNVRLIPLQ